MVGLLLMAVLLIMGFAVNELIIKEIRVEKSAVEAGKAYFAAEAGVEDALYQIYHELPGFETVFEGDLDGIGGNDFSYEIVAQEDAMPCQYDDPELPEWRSLEVNEAIKIPLFKDDGSGAQEDLTGFLVEFYVDDLRPNVYGDGLAWKVLGLISVGTEVITEAIADYIPLRDEINDPNDPGRTAFGTTAVLQKYRVGKYYDCRQVATQDCIYYPDREIGMFLSEHMSNYLFLTNVIDVDKQLGADDSGRNRIKFRLVAEPGASVVCEYARIRANGASAGLGQSKSLVQNLNVDIKPGSFLPVFEFSLYEH